MSFFGFSSTAVVEIEFDRKAGKASIEDAKAPEGGGGGGPALAPPSAPGEGPTDARIPIIEGKEDVGGIVRFRCPPGKKIEHGGIKMELKGVIEYYYDSGSPHEFLTLVHELEPAGNLEGVQEFKFLFAGAHKDVETYNGINVRVRYFVRVTAARSMATNLTKSREFIVQNVGKAPEINNTIKMEVGIEDCLHIEFEYNKARYHMTDVVTGKIFFLLVRIKIQHMELAIIRKESSGSGSNVYNESDTLAKYEVMDGAPVRGESIPIRLYLSGFDLTPTYKVPGKFSVKYFLNLVLVDQEDRRYFKQQEIVLWREAIK